MFHRENGNCCMINECYRFVVVHQRPIVDQNKQLNLKNMVILLSLGELLGADELFEAALKMTKTNMPWLKTQV